MTSPSPDSHQAATTSQFPQAAKRKLDSSLAERYQVAKLISSDVFHKTYLAQELTVGSPPKPCWLRILNIPHKNPNTLSLVFNLIQKKILLLEELRGEQFLPPIIDFFLHNEQIYLVQTFVEGDTLKEQLAQQSLWTESQAIDFLVAMLELLQLLHNQGLIYQSLQPENILVRDTEPPWVLGGLGFVQNIIDKVVRAQNSDEPLEKQCNSPYLAPEQLLGKPQFNSDIYALGVITIQGLTGIKPEQLHTAIEHGHWQQSCNISRSLARLIEGMVQMNSQHRYQLVHEVIADLQQPPDQWGETEREPSFPTINADSSSSTSGGEGDRDEAPTAFSGSQSSMGSSRSRPQWGWKIMVACVAIAAIAIFTGLIKTRKPTAIVQSSSSPPQTLDYYNGFLAQHPDDGEAYYQRGLLYQDQQNSVAALKDFSKALEKGYESPNLYYYRGNSRFKLGDGNGAIKDYQAALVLDPNHTESLVNLGNAYANTGDEATAIANYTKAIKINPTFAAAYLNRCLSRSNTGDDQGAVEDCTEAINLRPAHTFAYENRGLAKRRLGNLAGAIEDFNIAISIEPTSADPYYNRGLVRYELGDYQGAMMDFDETIKLNPKHPFAYYDRGSIHELQQRPQQAAADFEQASRICLELARIGCHEDAKYRLEQLQQPSKEPVPRAQ